MNPLPCCAPVLAAWLLLLPAAPAQVPVKLDLNTGLAQQGSEPEGFRPSAGSLAEGRSLELGGFQYFLATTAAHGRELWRSDGTATGTQLVVDLWPGPGSGTGTSAAVLNGRLYFVGDDGISGPTVWSTAGGAPTPLPGYVASTKWPEQLTASGSSLYFVVPTSSTDETLWVTDGTAAGLTPLLQKIGVGTTYYRFNNLYPSPAGTGLFFGVDVPSLGEEPWFTDGTAAGTVSLGDLNPGFGDGYFLDPVALGSLVLFRARGGNGLELYRTDGTAAGTYEVIDILFGSPSSLPELSASGVAGGELFFTASSGSGLRGLWRTDGTQAGTSQVTAVPPTSSFAQPEPLGAVGGQLVLAADLDLGLGKELYLLAGSSLVELADLAPGAAGSSPSDAMALGGDLLVRFAQADGSIGLAVTDGTAPGTQVLTMAPPVPQVSPPYMQLLGSLPGGQALLGASVAAAGSELVTTDGSVGGTGLLSDLEPSFALIGSDPRELLCASGQDLYLLAETSVGSGLVSLRSGQIPAALKAPGAPELQLLGADQAWLGDHDEVFYSVYDTGGGTLEFKVVATDGTLAGSGELFRFPVDSLFPTFLGSDGELLYYAALTPGEGAELWVSDGTTPGTQLLKDLAVGPDSSSPRPGVAWQGAFYFSAQHSPGDAGLWRTDGTAAGTQLVRGGFKATSTVSGFEIFQADGRLYFVADDGASGRELWSSDGTSAGTQLVADLHPGTWTSDPRGLVEFQGQLHFLARTAFGSSLGLWRTDGTAAGTQAIPGVLVADFETPVVAGGRLYLVGTDPATGDELWSYDGTAAGLVAELTPGPDGSELGELTTCGDRLYFAASSPATGPELFVSDGSVVSLVSDLNPGPEGSSPGELTLCDGALFFQATGADQDTELYRLDLPDAHVLDLGFGGSGARLAATAPTVGGGVTFEVTDAPLGALGVLALGAPLADPLGLFVETGSALWIDPLGFQLLAVGGAPAWAFTQAIPALPSFVGAQVNVQAWFLPPSLLPATTSNGLRLVLGS